jgi:hypothetical protein
MRFFQDMVNIRFQELNGVHNRFQDMNSKNDCRTKK